MRLLFGIPLMFLLLAASTYGSRYSPVDLSLVLVALTALWAALDAKRIDAQRYDSAIAMHPVGLFLVLLLFWPITFPWYLKLKYRIAQGEIGQRSGSRVLAVVMFSVFGLLIVGGAAAGYILLQRAGTGMKNIFELASAVSTEFNTQTNVSINDDRELRLTLVARGVPTDTAIPEPLAKKVAAYALAYYAQPDSLKSVTVVLEEKKQQGPVTITGRSVKYSWSVAQLRDSATAPTTTVAQRTVPGARPEASVPQPSRSAAQAVTPAGTPVTPAAARRPAAFEQLASADRAVRWATDSTLVADFDCDATADTVGLGRKRREIHVGLVGSLIPEPQILIFDVGAGVRGAVCSESAFLALESLDFDPADKGLKGIEGHRRSGTCKGLTLGDGKCRNIHVFWSHKTRHLEWFHR